MKKWQKTSLTALFYALPFMSGAALAEEKPEAEEPKTEQQSPTIILVENARYDLEKKRAKFELPYPKAAAEKIYESQNAQIVLSATFQFNNENVSDCPYTEMVVENVSWRPVLNIFKLAAKRSILITVNGVEQEDAGEIISKQCLITDKSSLMELIGPLWTAEQANEPN